MRIRSSKEEAERQIETLRDALESSQRTVTLLANLKADLKSRGEYNASFEVEELRQKAASVYWSTWPKLRDAVILLWHIENEIPLPGCKYPPDKIPRTGN